MVFCTALSFVDVGALNELLALFEDNLGNDMDDHEIIRVFLARLPSLGQGDGEFERLASADIEDLLEEEEKVSHVIPA